MRKCWDKVNKPFIRRVLFRVFDVTLVIRTFEAFNLADRLVGCQFQALWMQPSARLYLRYVQRIGLGKHQKICINNLRQMQIQIYWRQQTSVTKQHRIKSLIIFSFQLLLLIWDQGSYIICSYFEDRFLMLDASCSFSWALHASWLIEKSRALFSPIRGKTVNQRHLVVLGHYTSFPAPAWRRRYVFASLIGSVLY